MINAIDHELTGAINHAEIELHETAMEGAGVEAEKTKLEKSGKIGELLSANLFTKGERKGKGEKKKENRFMQWNNGIIDGKKGNETRTEIERSYSLSGRITSSKERF